jgi:hypothetical protein
MWTYTQESVQVNLRVDEVPGHFSGDLLLEPGPWRTEARTIALAAHLVMLYTPSWSTVCPPCPHFSIAART